ncbi:hypothetical protein KPY62_05950 [Psychrobacter sp. TAE2020]|uniref:hypothetical protein n=1 Tax=Psychrobacter sp. TAE2020 TaxID=2846762 RepID=UPI001C122998|nr:hypothetical protein [Psychrobacter sp. TAE2020]MBU5616648.1 hypothetical protein [Psychrobacter sp. TAE2020]
MLNISSSSMQGSKVYKQLIRCEQQWWKTRQRLVILKERQLFWYGDNSLKMWLLWQLLSYIVIAIVLMMLSKLLQLHLTLWQGVMVFGLQTLFFVGMLVSKTKLSKHMQHNIDQQSLIREQALTEMNILASDSILPDIHANTPISLQHIYERYDAQLRRASLQRLLQIEVEAGRMMLGAQNLLVEILPPEFADNELIPYARKMVYTSTL